jgi:putative tricarboxylic transport membrane protein
MEASLRRAMVLSDGDWAYVLSSYIAVVFWLVAMAIFVALFLRQFLPGSAINK